MANIKQQFLEELRKQPGWAAAQVDTLRQEERSVHFDKGDGSNKKFAVFSHRRMAHKRPDGSFEDIVTDWQQATGRDIFKIEVGDYTLFAGGRDSLVFGNDDMLRYQSGNTNVSITPLSNLFWKNNRGQERVIRNATSSVGALLKDNPAILQFPDAYGQGFDYELVAEADRVYKRVRIPNKSALGSYAAGEHLVLGNKIVMDRNSEIFWFDDISGKGWTQWDGVAEIVTHQPIQVRDRNGFKYAFNVPFIQSNHIDRGIGPRNREIAAGIQLDQHGELVATYSWYRLWLDGQDVRLDCCFNPDVFPEGDITFYLDPTFDLDVTDPLSAEDNSYSGTRPNTGKNYVDCTAYGGGYQRLISNWDVSAYLDGSSTITSAVLSIYVGSAPADWDSNIRMEDTGDSTFPTSGTECNNRYAAWSATAVNWDTTSTGRQNTTDFASLLESTISGDTVGEVGVDIQPIGTAFTSATLYTYGYGATFDLNFIVEYEEGSGGGVQVVQGLQPINAGVTTGLPGGGGLHPIESGITG